MRLWGVFLLLGSCLLASVGAAQEAIPLGPEPNWRPRPDWLGNGDDRAQVAGDQAAVQFTVPTAGKGMKWLRQLPGAVEFASYTYLLVTYRAQGLVAADDYALWLQDGSSAGKPAILLRDLVADGTWHTVAVDTMDLAPAGPVTALAAQVQAAAPQAQLALREVRLADELPEGAQLLQRKAGPPETWRLKLSEQPLLQARPPWLANPAEPAAYRASVREGVLRLEVDEAGRGMKWSLAVPDRPDVGAMPWFALRYRAHNVGQHGDYLVWLGAEVGGGGQQFAQPLSVSDARDDGQWHVERVKLAAGFQVAEMAFQVQATGPGAWLEVDYVVLSSQRPKLTVADMLPVKLGWEGAEPSFVPVDIAQAASTSHAGLMHWWGLEDWLPVGQVQVSGIRFQVSGKEKDLCGTSLAGPSEVTVPVGAKGSELLLILGARFPHRLAGGYDWSPQAAGIGEVERLVFEIEYETGPSDRAFPIQVDSRGSTSSPQGEHEVVQGLGVYALPMDPQRMVKALGVHDGMAGGGFYVAAVSVNTGPRRFADEPPQPARQPKAAGEASKGRAYQPGVSRQKGWVVVRTPMLEARLSDNGLLRLELASRATAVGLSASDLGEIVSVQVGGQAAALQVAKGVVDEAKAVAVLSLEGGGAAQGLSGRLTAAARADAEIALTVELSNASGAAREVTVTAPAIGPMALAQGAADTWYCFPRRGDVISNIPIHLREPYSGLKPLQFMGFYSRRTGSGLWVRVEDLEDIYKHFELTKTERSIEMKVEWPTVTLAPGEKWTSAPVVLALYEGGWRTAFETYVKWMRTWYRSAAPRPQWFRRVFNFRQHFLHQGLFDPQTGAYQLAAVRAADRKAFGAIDYMHLFDWGASQQYGRCGDYNHYDEIGGLEAFRSAIGDSQRDSAPVGLYIEGYLVNKNSVLGQAHGAEWQMLNAQGQEYGYFSSETEPNYDICPNVAAWQDHMAQTFARVAKETGANGLYVDEFGFGDPGKLCYNPAHGHPVPMPPIRGERDFLRKVRAALPQSVALYTEEKGNDFNTQFTDGAFSYSVTSASDDWAPHHIDLMRFALPEFKVFQLVAYNPLVNGNWGVVKFVFFNGEGIWLQGQADQAYDEGSLAFLRRMFRLQHEHADAFTSTRVRPLVPTLVEGVYANEFAAEHEIVWTLYNANWQTVRGQILIVPHRRGARYRDLWNDGALEAQVGDRKAVLSFELGPRDVGCVAAQW